MSEPQRWSRYFHKQTICIGMRSQDDGEYVRYEDYARIQAEVERLTAEFKNLERYRKGGEKDGLYDPLTALELVTNMYRDEKAENARLKESLRLQIEQNSLAQIGFKMYQDNVDSGGLHKDRKDAIERYQKEVHRLQAQVERLTKAGDEMAFHIGNDERSQYMCADAWRAAKEIQL